MGISIIVYKCTIAIGQNNTSKTYSRPENDGKMSFILDR